MSDFRVELAQCLWNCGLGRDPAVNASDFEDYLDGIPQIPASLIAEDPDLPFLSLADPRPGLLQSCKLLGIKYEELGYTDEDAVPFDDRFVTPTTPFWFRHDDGRTNRNRRPDNCRDELTGDIQTGTAMEGVFAFANHTDIVKEGEHIIDLPGTVRHSRRVNCACLRVWDGQVRLYLYGSSGVASPGCGALRVRRK